MIVFLFQTSTLPHQKHPRANSSRQRIPHGPSAAHIFPHGQTHKGDLPPPQLRVCRPERRLRYPGEGRPEQQPELRVGYPGD